MSFPRYQKYKNSGLHWLGEIPTHWTVARLGFECDTVVPMRDKPADLSGSTPWVRIEDFTGRYIGESKSQQGVSDETIAALNLKVLPIGAVLCSCSCNMGATAIVTRPLVTNQTFIGIVPRKQSYLPEYLYFLLRAAAEHLNSIGTGAIQSYLSREDFRNLRVPRPTMPEQAQIVSFLDREIATIDALLAEQQRLIDLLKEKRQAVISRTITKGLNPDRPMKASGDDWVGNVPAHWRTVPLMRLTPDDRQIMYGIVLPGPHVDDGVPIVKGGDVKLHRLNVETLNRTTREIEAGYERSRLRGGDIVYAIRGSIGEAEIVPESLAGANLTQDAARISPRVDVHGRWLLYALRADEVFRQLDSQVTGATIRGINIFSLKRALIPTPPPEEQRQIADFLTRVTAAFDRLTREAEDAVTLLQERRTALIAAAVTGKIDVRGLAADAA